MKQFSKTVFYRLPVISLCAFIFWQSSFSGIISQPLFPHDDKVMHFLVYALLAFLTIRCLTKENLSISKKNTKIITIIFVSLYGLSDEIHQAFVPERCASSYDFIADFLGAIIGTLSYQLKKISIYFQN